MPVNTNFPPCIIWCARQVLLLFEPAAKQGNCMCHVGQHCTLFRAAHKYWRLRCCLPWQVGSGAPLLQACSHTMLAMLTSFTAQTAMH